MLTLGLTCSSAMAEWTKVDKSANGKFTFYVDLVTIRVKGNTVKMWSLNDYIKPEPSAEGRGKFYKSAKGQSEYNCDEETKRLLAYSLHSKNMGLGEVLLSNYGFDGQWGAIAPDSIDSVLFSIACGKH